MKFSRCVCSRLKKKRLYVRTHFLPRVLAWLNSATTPRLEKRALPGEKVSCARQFVLTLNVRELWQSYSVCTGCSSDSCYFHKFLRDFFSLSSPLHITNIYTVLIKCKLILQLEWKSANNFAHEIIPSWKGEVCSCFLPCILGGINVLSWLLWCF